MYAPPPKALGDADVNLLDRLVLGLRDDVDGVALAYVLRQPSPALALAGTRSEAHLDELLGAASLALTPAELSWLEAGS